MVADTGVDALSNGNSLGDEVLERPAVMLYRAVFILLGLAFGWLLWKTNRRERQYRQLTETLGRIQRECEQHTLLLRATLQNLLIRNDLHLSEAASQLLRQAYQQTQEFQRIAELKLPSTNA